MVNDGMKSTPTSQLSEGDKFTRTRDTIFTWKTSQDLDKIMHFSRKRCAYSTIVAPLFLAYNSPPLNCYSLDDLILRSPDIVLYPLRMLVATTYEHLSTSLMVAVCQLSGGDDTGRVPGGPGISGFHIDLQQLWPAWADWTGQSCQVGQWVYRRYPYVGQVMVGVFAHWDENHPINI